MVLGGRVQAEACNWPDPIRPTEMQKVVISIHVSHYWHSHLFVGKQFLWSIAVIRAAPTSDQGWLLALWCYTTVQLSARHWPSQYVSFGDYPLVWITHTFRSCHRQTTEPPKLLTIKGKGHISAYCLPEMKTHSTFLIYTTWLVEVCNWSATSSKIKLLKEWNLNSGEKPRFSQGTTD